MTNNTAFAELMAFQRQTEALSKVAERLGWDQETMMPRGGAEQRGEEMAAMEGVLHARRTDPRIAEWLAAADPEDAPGKRAYEVFVRCFEKGALIRVTGDIIALSPPLIMERSQIDDLFTLLQDVLQAQD